MSSNAPASKTTHALSTHTALLADYWALAKPEISFLVTISAGAGFMLGTPGALDGLTLLITLVGVWLCAGGAGALNHYLERDLDAQMKRTRDRTLPSGRVSPEAARTYGFALIAAGVALICPLVNPLTAVLALLSVGLYLLVYTPLKRKTKYNTLIGTIPGALPALGGYTAATGTLGAGGWALFAILATWQMPHFLSLGWMYRHDYARGGYKMLPVVEPEGASTARQTVLFTALLLVASVLPFFVSTMGWIYLAGTLPLGLWFLVAALRFARERTGYRARHVLKVSIYYIPLLTALIVLDWLI